MPFKTKEARKAYLIRYNAENRPKILAGKLRYRTENKEKVNAAQRDHYKRNKEQIRAKQNVSNRKTVLAKYDLTIEEYAVMEKAQNGLCFLCLQPETATSYGRVCPLSVDHNHKTGENRALLCRRCNFVAGVVEGLGVDLGPYLKRIADYLDGETA